MIWSLLLAVVVVVLLDGGGCCRAAAAFSQRYLDLAIEKQLWQRQEPPISTLTWFRERGVGYENDGETGADDVELFIRGNIRQIVRSNPWLLGKVKGGKNYFSGAPAVLEYDDDEVTVNSKNSDDHIDDLLNVRKIISPREASSIHRHTPIEELYAATVQWTAETNRLWRVTIIHGQDHNHSKFYVGVMSSLSHMVGDIHVYYQLQDMLFGTAKVRALDIESVPNSDEVASKVLGKSAFKFQNSLFTTTLKGALGLVERVIFQRKVEELWFSVDNDSMRIIKEEATADDNGGGGDFVSTNDVLTSWFFKNTGSSIGLMCANYRGRLPGHDALKGRNYWGVIVYQPTDFDHPTKIRRSLAAMQRSDSGELPSPWDLLRSGSVAIATSWTAGKRSEWDLPGCTEEVHLPLFDFAAYCPARFVVMRIFTPRRGAVGVYVAGDARMMERLKEAPFLSGKAF